MLGLTLDDGDVELDRDDDGESLGVLEGVSETLALKDRRGVLEGDDDTLAHLDVCGLLVIEIVGRIVFVPVIGALSLRVAARDQLALFDKDPIDSDAEGLLLLEYEADGDIDGLLVSDVVGLIVFDDVRKAVRLKVAAIDRLALPEWERAAESDAEGLPLPEKDADDDIEAINEKLELTETERVGARDVVTEPLSDGDTELEADSDGETDSLGVLEPLSVEVKIEEEVAHLVDRPL